MRIKIGAVIAILALGSCQAEQAADNGVNAAAEEAGPAAPQTDNILSTPDAAVEAGDRSQFTSIDPDKCRLLEQNLEEGGWWRRLCEGAAGYKLELSESDLRQDIEVIAADGRRSELGLSEIVANGAFNSLGKTAEWRGADPARPEALIVRLGVASDPEGKKPDVSNLVVVRLKAPACIVAVVPPGGAQNERARAIADGRLPACFKRR